MVICKIFISVAMDKASSGTLSSAAQGTIWGPLLGPEFLSRDKSTFGLGGIFTNPSSDKGLISKKYKELKKLDTKTLINPIKKWGTELNREFTTYELQMAKRHLMSCSTSLVIREMQIKTTLRYHLTPVRIAKVKNTNDSLCWRGCGVRGTLVHCWWECKLVQPLWKSVWWFLRKLGVNLPQDTAIPLLGIYPRCPIILQKHLFNYVHSCTMCNSQNLETT